MTNKNTRAEMYSELRSFPRLFLSSISSKEESQEKEIVWNRLETDLSLSLLCLSLSYSMFPQNYILISRLILPPKFTRNG